MSNQNSRCETHEEIDLHTNREEYTGKLIRIHTDDGSYHLILLKEVCEAVLVHPDTGARKCFVTGTLLSDESGGVGQRHVDGKIRCGGHLHYHDAGKCPGEDFIASGRITSIQLIDNEEASEIFLRAAESSLA